MRGRAVRLALHAALPAAILGALACGDDPTAAAARCQEASEIAPGDAVPGALAPSDALFEGALIDYYALRLARPDSITVLLSSVQFDPFLYLFDADGAVIAQAYDSVDTPAGRPETAILSRRLDAACHLIGASSWATDTVGVYNLRVVRHP